MKKIIALFIFLVIVVFPVYFILAHDVPRVPSNESGETIGAYYDEEWQAIGYAYTREGSERTGVYPPGNPDNHVHPAREAIYETLVYNSGIPDQDPRPPQTAAIVREEPRRRPSNGEIIPGATLAQELLVIKWRATGHIHFTE